MPDARSQREARQQRAAALREEQARAERRAERRTRIVIAVAVLAGVVAIGVAVQASRSGGGDSDAAVPAGVTAPAGGLVLTAEQTTPGAAAPVKVDEWIDFQCPFCQQFHTDVGPRLDELVADGTIELEFHPLSFIGEESVRAANAFGCAIDAGEGKPYLDMLFANQPEERTGGYTVEDLIGYGEQVGLTDNSFQTCVRDDAFGGWVTNVAKSGNEAGVTSTPTLIVAGQKVEDMSQAGIEAAIAAAAGTGNPTETGSPTATPTPSS